MIAAAADDDDNDDDDDDYDNSDYYYMYIKKKLRDATNHTFTQTTHVALPPPKLSCGVWFRM